MRARGWSMLTVGAMILASAVSMPAGGDAHAVACRINQRLAQGNWGDSVLCVERALLERGYMDRNIDIRFGSTTADAVRQFRRDHGIGDDPVVGPLTAQALGIWARRRVPTHHPVRTRVLGQTVRGRTITAYRYGNRRGKVAVAIGQIHGNEPGGAMIAAYLRHHGATPGVDLWVIDSVNLDGWRSQRRTNARGVDLNRNFAAGNWRYGGRGTPMYSGPSAASEPETRAVQRFLRRVDPRVMIVWHQIGRHVDDNRSVANRALLRQYAGLVGFPIRATGSCRRCGGTATAYVNRRLGGTAFTVEMPATFSYRAARNHGNAFLRVAAAS